ILAQDTAPWVVLGLRSIGTSLGAVVATAGKVGAPPLTLRPTGHPFQRVIRLTSSLERQLFAQGPETRFALVDEGPGLSGSSFGAVADWLEGHQIPPGHIHFFPGHAGDLGPQASERHRLRWQQKSRHVVAFETLLHPTNPHALSWFEDGVCPAELDLKDVAGGRWRAQHFSSEADWPPCHTLQERRKYLYRARGRIWLAKFAGLGRYGDSKWARARRLERLGLIPPIRDLRHGFLIGEWLTSARPYCLGMTVDRGALLETLTAYLNFLARECPARAAWGASPEQLFAMAHFNIQERLGPEMAAGFEPWRGHLSALARRHRPVLTDNKMHAWEWLLLPDGRWLKADALDHHQGHDCIGAQDLAWDLEGACVELELTETEQAILERTLSLPAAVPPPQVRRFYRECYLAFQMGYFTLAADTLAAPQPEEAVRLRAAAQRYAERLSRELIASLPS
ncbi:MAG: hypothetical protein JO112_06785, partial [Planctomycetes bacterium]|nr:hypothetical protein [Planctomycetota bacterium]